MSASESRADLTLAAAVRAAGAIALPLLPVRPATA